MLPVISIVGRPNVGKSTLFNRLTRSRDALVDDIPGVTRDSLYGVAQFGDRKSMLTNSVQGNFLIVDTGGIGENDDTLSKLISSQVESVLEDSDAIVFLVDATQGLTVADEQIAQRLGKIDLPLSIAVNKSEGLVPELACLEFQSLGFSDPIPISARRGSGVSQVFDPIVKSLPQIDDPLWLDPGPKIAVIGKPNVGKSTLINSIFEENRLIVSDVPGTTRDSVVVPLERKGERFRFIDTAGVRRRSRVGYSLEKLSVVKTLQAIEAAHVVVLLLDGTESIADQDATLAGLIRRAGRPVVIVVNKSDKIKNRDRTEIRGMLQRKLAFAPHHEALFVSGLKRQGISKLLEAVGKAYRSAMIEMPTSILNRYLQDAITQTPPPMSKRRQVEAEVCTSGRAESTCCCSTRQQRRLRCGSLSTFFGKLLQGAFQLFGADVRVFIFFLEETRSTKKVTDTNQEFYSSTTSTSQWRTPFPSWAVTFSPAVIVPARRMMELSDTFARSE